MFRSALLKLTIGYVVIVVVLSLVFSVVIYHFATVELREGLNRQYKVLIDSNHDSDNILGLSEEVFSGRANQLYVDLVYFNVVVLVLASIGSYALARRTLRPIEAAHRAQVRFTAHASHELRTPLAAIKADTESVLMLKDPGSKLLTKTLKSNLEDLGRIENLANRLLEVSRIRSSTSTISHPIELAGLSKGCVRQAKRTPAGKTAKFVTDLTNLRIKGDPVSLDVVITTLLDNAIKYSPSGSLIRIEVAQAGRQALITIQDEGVGIPPEDIKHLFEPFYRSKTVSQDNIKGFGLGLSLAKEIIEAHGGTINIESVVKQGTRVILKLPLA